MKAGKILLILPALLILATLLASGQSVPQLINYQGRLTNASGQPLDGVSVDLTFRFYSAETAGAIYLAVSQPGVQVSKGVYNVLIGSGAITPGTESTLAGVFQKHGEVWMSVQVGNDSEMIPRSLITSVPYAFRAQSIDASAIYAALEADPDHDSDGIKNSLIGGSDCNDNDPNNWASCAACADNDLDLWSIGCDAYVTISGPDCADWNPNIYPGAPELCDDHDNQCPGDPGYGITDEGCPPAGPWQKIGEDVRITNAPGDSHQPSLVWTGTEYGVSWFDGRNGNYEIYFARITANGTKIGADVRITNDPDYGYAPSLVWTGTEYGVSWWDNRDGNDEIYFARIAASGTKVGGDVRISNYPSNSGAPSLVWAGTEYGVSWYDYRDGNFEIYFARIAANGTKIGGDVRITNDPNDSYSPSLVWTGTEYGVSWYDYWDGNSEIYFARIAANGTKIGSDVRITNDPDYYSYAPSLVWTGTEYGVSWVGGRDVNWEVYFARITANGTKSGADVRITNDPGYASDSPSLVWTGTEYGVSWFNGRDGNYEIYFVPITANGTKIGGNVLITNSSIYGVEPSLVWAGTEYGVSWAETLNYTSREIYFARKIGVRTLL